MTRLATVLAGAAALVAMTSATFAQEVILKLHQMLPPQATIPAKALAPWAEKVMAESGGRIKIEIFSSMQLGGKPSELYDQVKDGVVDLVWTQLSYMPGRFAAAEAFELPFIATNAEASSKALQQYCERRCAQEFEGVKVIAWHVDGPGLIHSKNPITKLEEMNGLKIRDGARPIDRMFEKLGARMVEMPVTVVPESLSKGLIDATTMSWEMTPALKVGELVKNHTGFTGANALYTEPFVFAMNLDSYNRLPDDLQRVIDVNSGISLAASMGKVLDEADVEGRSISRKLGNSIAALDEVETQRWKDAAAPLIEQWETDMTANGFDGKALVAEARSLVERYSAPPPEEPEEKSE